jgi:hypothetical protein
MKHLYLAISVLLTAVAIAPYIKDIVRKKTIPNLISWLTWTILTGLATVAEIDAHADITAIFTGAATIETLVVVLFGLKYGYVKYHWLDGLCQVGAIIGFILWGIFDSPTIAIVAAVGIDFIAGLPTWRHAYIKPSEETWETYALSGIGGIFALLALSSHTLASLSYPIFITLSCLIVTVIIHRRNNIKKPSKTHR